MAAVSRGVKEIKTLAAIKGSGARGNARHVLQFQLASLELERERRLCEKASTLRRIMEIDSRLLEIESIMHKLHEALGLCSEPTSGGTPSAGSKGSSATVEKRRVLRY